MGRCHRRRARSCAPWRGPSADTFVRVRALQHFSQRTINVDVATVHPVKASYDTCFIWHQQQSHACQFDNEDQINHHKVKVEVKIITLLGITSKQPSAYRMFVPRSSAPMSIRGGTISNSFLCIADSKAALNRMGLMTSLCFTPLCFAKLCFW